MCTNELVQVRIVAHIEDAYVNAVLVNVISMTDNIGIFVII